MQVELEGQKSMLWSVKWGLSPIDKSPEKGQSQARSDWQRLQLLDLNSCPLQLS